MESRTKHIILVVAANFCRLFLAAVFMISGFAKAVDPLGTYYKIQDYFLAFGLSDFMPDYFALLGSFVLSWTEFLIGFLFLMGIRRSLSTIVCLIFMGLMTPLTLYLALFNPVSDCGCFGDAFVLTNWQTFIKNLILLSAAILAFRWRRLFVRFFSVRLQGYASLWGVFFIVGLSIYCFNHLPILDFRPFKIGKSIIEGMSVPADAEMPVYKTTFLMEKDGMEQIFTVDNYPDSTWTFKDSKTVLVKPGYEPPIHDFLLQDRLTGTDLTEQILENPDYTFLMVGHRLDEASDGEIDLINEIYDYALEHKYNFYCLTSSSDEVIEEWCDKTGAEYPFCLADDTMLKTVIRSNPGMVLLKKGIVVNKWSNEDLPDEYVLTDRLEKLALGQVDTRLEAKHLGYAFLWFITPIVLLLMIDLPYRYKMRQKAEIQK